MSRARLSLCWLDQRCLHRFCVRSTQSWAQGGWREKEVPLLHHHAYKRPSLPFPSRPHHFHPRPLATYVWWETKEKSMRKQPACMWPGMRHEQHATADQDSVHRPVGKISRLTGRLSQKKVAVSGERNMRRLGLGCSISLMRTGSVRFEGRGKSTRRERSRAQRPRGRGPLQWDAKHLQGAPFSPLHQQPVRILSDMQQGRAQCVASVNDKSYEAQEGG